MTLWVAIVGVISVIVGGLFTALIGPIVMARIYKERNDADADKVKADADKVKADAGKTIGESYEGLLDRLEKTIHNQGEQLAAQTAEIAHLKDSVDALRIHAARFKNVPDFLPMSDFVDTGLLSKLNDAINPLGVHITMYVDDIDGRVALGWRGVAAEGRSVNPTPPSVKRRREESFNAMVERVLSETPPEQ